MLLVRLVLALFVPKITSLYTEHMASGYCTHCGKAIEAKHNFCGNCGASLRKDLQVKAVPFITNPSKLAILSVATLGVYDIYWLYKQWRHVKLRDSVEIKPFWRAIFYPFFTYALLKKLQHPKAGMYATSYIVLTFLGLIPYENYFLCLSSLAFLPIYLIQQRINEQHGAESQGSNYAMRAKIGIGVGLLAWIFFLSTTMGFF